MDSNSHSPLTRFHHARGLSREEKEALFNHTADINTVDASKLGTDAAAKTASNDPQDLIATHTTADKAQVGFTIQRCVTVADLSGRK
jgi:hypothetical protein